MKATTVKSTTVKSTTVQKILKYTVIRRYLTCICVASICFTSAFSEVAYAAEAQNQYIMAPIQESMTVEQDSVVSQDDTLLIVKQDDISVELLAVTYFKGKSIAGTQIDTPKEYREFATGLYQGAGKKYKLTPTQIAAEMQWGEWNVYQFQTKIDLEGDIQDADAYSMVHSTGDIVFAVHMMPQGREAIDAGIIQLSLKGLELKTVN
jgi:hypothetical protein